MSTFSVTRSRIKEITEHPNAERLELAFIEDNSYQMCVRKGEYSVGDDVLYFPVDAILPQELVVTFGLEGRLSGPLKNRVKTVELRGQPSQGLLCKTETLFPDGVIPENVTETLGVTKHEPPEQMTASGNLVPLPEGLGVYDIENAENFSKVVEALLDQPVLVTEKIEGTNFAALKLPDGTKTCAQRNYMILDVHSNSTHYAVAEKLGLFTILDEIPNPNGELVAIRGELIGPKIQGNYYGVPNYTVKVFDIKVGNRYLGVEDLFRHIPEELRVPTLSVGVTLREYLNGAPLPAFSDGESVLVNKLREGIVIKPMVEQSICFKAGRAERLILKQRSPKYLAKQD